MKNGASIDQLFLEEVHEVIENNLSQVDFGVDELAHKIGISRSQLHRRLKIITGKSASKMIKEIRLNKAFEMMQSSGSTAADISFRVGFSSPSYFNTCFHEYFGYPPGKVRHNKSPESRKKHAISRKYLIILLAAIIVAVSTLILYLDTRIANNSIAVLPFTYLGDDPEMQYLADGVMNAIVLHLSKIEGLKVMDRTSVERYRETDKSAVHIGQELNVAYLLEGSFQKYGDQVRLIVQLIRPGKEGHIWAQEYDRYWKDIFSVQSEVAQTIAREIRVVIKPEGRLLNENKTTHQTDSL